MQHVLHLDDEDLALVREAIHLLHVAECERFHCLPRDRQYHAVLVSAHTRERRDRAWHLREYVDSLLPETSHADGTG